jgi:hypothetical protein
MIKSPPMRIWYQRMYQTLRLWRVWLLLPLFVMSSVARPCGFHSWHLAGKLVDPCDKQALSAAVAHVAVLESGSLVILVVWTVAIHVPSGLTLRSLQHASPHIASLALAPVLPPPRAK